MGASTGPVILAGTLEAANEALFSPLAGGSQPDWGSVWRLVPVTAGLALGLDLLEKAVPEFATGLAWLLVVGALVYSPGHAGPVITNVNKVLKV